MTTFDSFMPYLLPLVPGCPDPAAYQALRWACIEFCKRTDTVQRVLTAVNVVADTQDYAVTPPTDMLLVNVLGVSHAGRWLDPVMPDDVESDTALRGADIGDVDLVKGTPNKYFLKTVGTSTVSLYPVPELSITGGLLIKASFKPTQTADEVDDILFNEYVEEIAAGAAAKLQATPGQPFTQDPSAALARFELGIGKAKRRKAFGQMSGSARVRPRRFA